MHLKIFHRVTRPSSHLVKQYAVRAPQTNWGFELAKLKTALCPYYCIPIFRSSTLCLAMSLRAQKTFTNTYLFNLYLSTSGCHHGSQRTWLSVDRLIRKLVRNLILVQRPVCIFRSFKPQIFWNGLICTMQEHT